MRLKEDEQKEIKALKEDLDKLDAVQSQVVALKSIAESLIVLKNKVGRKLP